jgi:sarcosine oxidase subunit beta
MSDRADAIVVGGGVQGLATAVQLLDNGVEDVRLLERDALCSGTSAAGAGFVGLWAMAPPYDERELAVERYGIDYYRRLQERALDIGFAQNGLLFVAADEPTWNTVEGTWRLRDHLDRVTAARPGADPEPVEVSAERVEELTGGTVLARGVHRGAFQAAAAQVFAPKVGTALATRFVEDGGKIDARRPVTRLTVEDGRVRGVETPSGRVESDTVIVVAGAWTNELLRPLGIYLPFVPLLTSRIITEPLDVPVDMPVTFLVGVSPTMPLLWLRSHEGALLWGGVYLDAPREALVDSTELPERFDEIPIDGVQQCVRIAEQVSAYVPALARYRSMKLKHGAPCYTPDHRALVGAVPGVDGLWVLAGDNEAGLTHGPGFAKALADHIVRGDSELADLAAWRVDRFDGRYRTDEEVADAVRAALTDQAEGKERPLGPPTAVR